MKNIIGNIVENEDSRIKTARIHQGWWRAFVLGEMQGPKPNSKDEYICNTIECDNNYEGNFLSSEISEVVKTVLKQRQNDSPGIIQENRLRGNLLSSQPLCFNFFGHFYNDKELALLVFKKFYPDISKVKGIMFEYAPTPKEMYTNDNSAFDVAIEVEVNGKTGLIGIECKYTETFSPKIYATEKYQSIFNSSNAFNTSFEQLTSSKFNQLFRNQLIAESLIQNKIYSFVNTALFCAPEDETAQKVGKQFQSLLSANYSNFQIITFFDLIESIQQNKLSRNQREYSMLLWARYLGFQLSAKARTEYINRKN